MAIVAWLSSEPDFPPVGQMVHPRRTELVKGSPAPKSEKRSPTWLAMFGHNLMTDFEIDPFTVLVRSTCAY